MSRMTAREACRLLGVAEDAPADAMKRAFKAAVKTARPDQPDGDEDRYRQVIEAYRLLQRLQALRATVAAARRAPQAAAPPSTPPVLEISVDEAMTGVARTVRLPGGKSLGLKLPAGLRNDDLVRLKGQGEAGEDLMLRVRITAEPNRAIQGADLWLTVSVEPRALVDGARVEVETPLGLRSVWIPKNFPAEGKLRLRGEGLPARGAHKAGDLFLKPVPGDAPVGKARDQLRRFARGWADLKPDL